jgi:hypothetical protein
LLGSAVHAAAGAGSKVKLVHCPGCAYIKKPPFFFKVFAAFFVSGKNALFNTGHDHAREFQALCIVQCDKCHRVFPGICRGISALFHGAVKFDMFQKLKETRRRRFV